MKTIFLATVLVLGTSWARAEAVTSEAIAIPSESSTAAATHSLKTLEEKEIPVRLEGGKKEAATDSPLWRMLAGLSIAGLMGGATWLLIRRSKTIGKSNSLAPEMKILAQHYLGPKKSLVILRVAGESILLGVTDNNIQLLKSLSLLDEEIPETTPSSFKSIFAGAQAGTEGKEDEDSFSISGIKDVVTTRLSKMRNFE